MAIKTIRVFAEYTSDGYVPMPSQGNIDYGVTVGSTFPETQPSSFQTDDPNIDVAVTTMTDFYVWIRTHGSAWNPNYTRVVRVYPDSPSINSVVMNMIVAVGGGGTTISSGGGVSYYLNGGTSQGILDGSTYYEMNKVPVQGSGVDFFKINTTGFQNIAQFVTDAGDPGLLNIPAGNWPLGFYMSASDNSGAPKFYAEIYKYSAAGVFTLLGSSVATPEVISNGQAIDYYTSTVAIPDTTLLVTDRIAIRIFVNTDGNRTINLHTQDSHLSTVGTTFTRGLTAINGLIKQVQFLAIGNAGSDAAIVSSDDTHTINLPTASATKRGLLNSTDWSTFNAKQPALSGDGFVKISGSTISYDNSSYQPLDGDLTAIGALAGTSGILKKTGANTWELDTSVYLSTTDAASTYQRLDKMVSNLLASDTEYPNSNAVLSALALKANATNPAFSGYMTISGASPKLYLTDTDNNPDYFIGNDDGYFRIYDQTNSLSRFYITNVGVSTFPGDVIVGSIAKSGGTASQFLKADGSVDSNTYVSSTTLSSYLLSADAATIYQRKDKMVSNLLASDTEYPNSNAVLAALALKANAANPTFTGNFTISGDSPKLYFVDTDNNPDYTLFTDSGYFYIYDQTAGATKFQITPSGNAINTGTLTSASFIKSGGTSSQFLKADGTVDSNTYLTSIVETDTFASVVARGASTLNKGIAIVANSSQGALYNDQLTFANNTTGDFIQIGFQQQDSDGMHHRGYIKSYKSTAGNYAGIVEIVARSVNGGTTADVLKLEAGQAPKWGGNIILHAANYSSYALPISGGTLTGNRPMQFDTGGGAILVTGNSGGWSMGTYYKGSDGVVKGGFGAYGGGSSFNWLWLGTGYDNTWAQINSSSFNTQVALQQNGNQVLHAGNYGSYALPLSGGTVTGLSIFNGKITLGSSSSGTWNGNKVGLTLNSTAEIRSLQTQDPPALTWHYEGLATRHILMTSAGTINVVSPSTENSGVAILAVNGNTVLHAGNVSSYALPISGGTLTGALNVRTGINLIKSDGSTQGGQLQYDSNVNQLYLWNSVTGGYFSIYTNGAERLQIAANGNTTINQGLTVNSELSVGPNSGSDNGIRVNYGNYASGYGRIRFYQDGSNHSTIHSFSNAWQGGTLQGHSSGALNLAGSYGVTIGDWNNVDMWIDKGGNAQARTSLRAPIFYDSNDNGWYADFNSKSRLNQIYADYISIGQDINTSYRLITNGSIYLNSNGNGWAEGVFKQRRSGGTFYDVIDAGNIGSQSVNYASYSGYSQVDFIHSGRDFPSGTLIQTNINYAVTYGDPWVLEIRGFGYNGAAPFDIQLAGYIYYDTIINQGGYSNGTNISGLRAINYNGNLCFWFPYQGYWQGYNVKAYIPYEGRQINRVTSISNVGQPTTAKQVDFTLHQSLRSDNAPYAWSMNQHVRTSDNVTFNNVNSYNYYAGAGCAISIGDPSLSQTYNDSTRSRFYAHSSYPALTLNSSITTNNANHGPTIQLTVDGYDSSRQWVMGTGGTGQVLDIGTSQQNNKNPHGGIAGYYVGTGGTYVRITKDGNVGIGYNWGDGNYGGIGSPSARLHVIDNNGTSYHGRSGTFRNTQSASGNFTPFAFVSDYGNHSWGIVARFYITQAGADRPSIQFAYGGSDTRWSVGYCYPDDHFRITQNQGFRNDGGTIDNGGWGYERLRINNDGTAQFFNTLTATAFYESSDSRLKKLLENDIDIKGIENLTAKLYVKDGRQEYGYFAQEAQAYMPSAVTVNDKGYLNLSYREVHTAKIARLEKRVAELEKQLNVA